MEGLQQLIQELKELNRELKLPLRSVASKPLCVQCKAREQIGRNVEGLCKVCFLIKRRKDKPQRGTLCYS